MDDSIIDGTKTLILDWFNPRVFNLINDELLK